MEGTIDQKQQLVNILNEWDIFINQCSDDFIHHSMMNVIESVNSIESMVDFANVIYDNIFLSSLSLVYGEFENPITSIDYWYYKNMYHEKITKSLHMRMNGMDLKLLKSIFDELMI